MNYLTTCTSRLVVQHLYQVSFKSIQGCRRSWEDKLWCNRMMEGQTKQTLNSPLPFYDGGIKTGNTYLVQCTYWNQKPFILASTWTILCQSIYKQKMPIVTSHLLCILTETKFSCLTMSIPLQDISIKRVEFIIVHTRYVCAKYCTKDIYVASG